MVLLDCFSSIKNMREPFPLDKNLVPVVKRREFSPFDAARPHGDQYIPLRKRRLH